MTPEPKPPILTAKGAEYLSAIKVYDGDALCEATRTAQQVCAALVEERAKVVPVRSEAEERERFEKWKRATWPNAGIMQRKMMHSAWLAATRDA